MNGTLKILFFSILCFHVGAAKMTEDALDPIYALILDNRVDLAMKKLKLMENLSSDQHLVREKLLRRFESAPPNLIKDGPLVHQLRSLYQNYWHRSLVEKWDVAQGDRYLYFGLLELSQRWDGPSGSFSEENGRKITDFLGQVLRNQGIYSLFGRVSPFLHFMAWRTEREKTYVASIGLGESEHVRVVLMEEFIVLGWAAYATFRKRHVGGWAKKDKLYCVASKYDLQSEEFRVSFLGHEARHFSDYKKYPSMEQKELEYRAKLTELILAEKTFEKLLRKFYLERSENTGNPHGYASFLIFQELGRALGYPIDLDVLLKKERAMLKTLFSKMLIHGDQ